MRVKLLRPGAKPPVRALDGDAGYDVCYAGPDTHLGLRPYAVTRVPTGIALDFSEAASNCGLRGCNCPDCGKRRGVVGLLLDRSSMANKGVVVVGGVLDGGHRGEVYVMLLNTTSVWVDLVVGQRVAQLVLQQVMLPPVEVVDRLGDSERGERGFGSTGE